MNKALRDTPFGSDKILVTGATGYLGALIVASLLRQTQAEIVCITRDTHDRQSLLEPIIEEAEAQGGRWTPDLDIRVTHIHIPGNDLGALGQLLTQLVGVDEIVHCAGCLDYYDIAKLEQVNIGYTQQLLSLGHALSVKRFVYVSTAFSCGYRDEASAEHLLDEPPSDPTDYTRTKRQAERLVAESGLPFVVMRPSILIGTSDTGRYSGKRYGVYQQWMGLERLACDRYHGDFHVVSSDQPLNLLHQDAFCQAFVYGHAWLPDGAFMNMVSASDTSPSLRDVWDMWFQVTRPHTIYYYESMQDVPVMRIHTRQRAFLSFAEINIQIAAHHWRFDNGWLQQLRHKGMRFTDASSSSLQGCLKRFVATSEVMHKYLTNHGPNLAPHVQVVHVPSQHEDLRQVAST